MSGELEDNKLALLLCILAGWVDALTIQSDAARDSAEADDDAPHFVDRLNTAGSDGADGGFGGELEGLLEAGGDDQEHDTGGKLAEALHRKHGVHHEASPLGCGELRGNNCRKRVVASVWRLHVSK